MHLCFDGTADFAGEARELSDTFAALKAAKNAVRNLEAGVTTVRDLGGWKSSVCEVAAAIERGLIPGPRVVAAGRALTITGGHGHNIGIAREVDWPRGSSEARPRGDPRRCARDQDLATGGVLTPGITADFTASPPRNWRPRSRKPT